MPRPSMERHVVRKRTPSGKDFLLVFSLRDQKDVERVAKKVFQDWQSGKHSFALDELYAVTDD